MINIHTHTFGVGAIPNRFLGIITPLLKFKPTNKLLTILMKYLNPFASNDELDKYAHFVQTSDKRSQLQIFNELKNQYPKNWQFVILPMDMAFCERGNVPQEYEQQLDELSQIARNDNSCIPFVMIDPNRANCLDIFKNAIEKLNFKGLKLYCNLGYYPTDERLTPIYQYCDLHRLPIIAHCTPNNPVYYNGSREQLMERLGVDELVYSNFRDNIQFFGNPYNYEVILKQYPNIKINFAHFGGSDNIETYLKDRNNRNWHTNILELIENYPNAYTDISYTLYDKKLLPYIKELMSQDKYKNKILFGSDYYMSQTVGNENYVLNEYLTEIEVVNFAQQLENNRLFLDVKE